MRVLCLDIEGGYGGSSRSLYESVRFMDRTEVALEVWCRRDGPIVSRYAALGVPCRVMPAMPNISALPRLSRNLLALAAYTRDFARARAFRQELQAAAEHRFDLVHFNHEGLAPLAAWLRPRTRTPLTMHIRTNLYETPFAAAQVRLCATASDHLVFITENEQATFRRRGGRGRSETVIYNIAPPSLDVAPHPAVPLDARFRIACLANYSWYRGLDRLVTVAECLKAMGHRNVLFVMAGTMHLTRSLPGALGRTAREGGDLADFAASRGVSDYFLFLGHVAQPETVLAACHALVKPTREDNPWGRDIIEALAAGLPVLTCGRYDRFVEDGVTGVLQPVFDADTLARRIAEFAGDRDRARILGQAGRERIATLCDGAGRTADLLRVWRSTRRAV